MKYEKSMGVDPKITAKEDLEVIKFSNDSNISKLVSTYTSLSTMERNNLIGLLKEHHVVFYMSIWWNTWDGLGTCVLFFECETCYYTCDTTYKNLSYRGWSSNIQEDYSLYTMSVVHLKMLKHAETRYPRAEQSCLALAYASQCLRHHFLAHKIQLMTQSHPIRSLLHWPILYGKLAQWLLHSTR